MDYYDGTPLLNFVVFFSDTMAEEARSKLCCGDTTGDAGTLKPLHVRTPLIESTPISKLVGCEVLMKMENVQPPGSFKIRGIGHKVQMVTHIVE